jgi:uncharacterized protein (DUF433 family)
LTMGLRFISASRKTMANNEILLGVGIYTVPEAARIARVSAARIRRWLTGYTFRYQDEERHSPPVWTPDLPVIGGALALSFRDLMEVRFVDYFLTAGVSWKTLRKAAAHAAEIVNSSHPFSTQMFKTDGKKIFAEFAAKGAGSKKLLELVRRQYNIPEVVEPRLYKGLVFSGQNIVRWFPLADSKRVVIDPRIGFGQPTVVPEGVPTSTLAQAFRVDGSIERVARWYEVSRSSVAAATQYEDALAA